VRHPDQLSPADRVLNRVGNDETHAADDCQHEDQEHRPDAIPRAIRGLLPPIAEEVASLAGVKEPGPLLAAGRDADIFEYGPGLVLRRSREGHSMAMEARVMEYVRSQGFPVPAIEELSDDGLDIVMERIEGADMVATMSKHPWTIPHQGRVLADLHGRLHALAAPDWMGDAPVGQGSRLLHLDLHPLNVMIGPRGPCVIDWTNACSGDPAVDVAVAWVLMQAGEVPAGRFIGAILGRARSSLVKNFLRSFDLDEVKPLLHDVVAWKVSDPHMSAGEQARMWELVRTAGRESSG
jgi:aminoglycoside phosphotransferase (APT) family kinase protein